MDPIDFYGIFHQIKAEYRTFPSARRTLLDRTVAHKTNPNVLTWKELIFLVVSQAFNG